MNTKYFVNLLHEAIKKDSVLIDVEIFNIHLIEYFDITLEELNTDKSKYLQQLLKEYKLKVSRKSDKYVITAFSFYVYDYEIKDIVRDNINIFEDYLKLIKMPVYNAFKLNNILKFKVVNEKAILRGVNKYLSMREDLMNKMNNEKVRHLDKSISFSSKFFIAIVKEFLIDKTIHKKSLERITMLVHEYLTKALKIELIPSRNKKNFTFTLENKDYRRND